MCYTDEKYEENLQQEKNRKRKNLASENVRDFYSQNREYIQKCYSYYEEYKRCMKNYVNECIDMDIKKLQSECSDRIILVITANPIEEGVLLHGLADAERQALDFYTIDGFPYHICKIYGYTIVHGHATSTGEETTRRVINTITKIITPKVIVLLGICYGIDLSKYKLGDVLIATKLKNYRFNFRDYDDSDQIILEAEEENLGVSIEPEVKMQRSLISKLNYRNIYSTIYDERQNEREVNWKEGMMLSANCLMSSKTAKEAVLKAFGNVKPKPIGGEMEGGGLLKSRILEDGFGSWMLIKSICDWGEKKNLIFNNPEENEMVKDSIQAMAMVHSWSVFYDMISMKFFE